MSKKKRFVASVPPMPSISALADAPTFKDLGLDDAQVADFTHFQETAERPVELHPGVVIRLDRGFPLVAIKNATLRAEHAATFAKQGKAASTDFSSPILPAIGDRVVVRITGNHDKGVIEHVLPRHTSFVRWRGRARGERQVLAANIDTVLIVQALGSGRAPATLRNRIARSLVLAADCSAQPVVILTKADRGTKEELEQALEDVHILAGSDVHILPTSSKEKQGLDAARLCVPKGSCALILGESGAGKSTLLNALLGHEALATTCVRERDDAGRHTTVARIMVKLPGGGVICDAPGLRSLPLVGHEQGLARVFPAVIEAAHKCRFNDCTHIHEPGCGVRDAVAEGQLDQRVVDVFLALASEMRVSAQSLDPDVKL